MHLCLADATHLETWLGPRHVHVVVLCRGHLLCQPLRVLREVHSIALTVNKQRNKLSQKTESLIEINNTDDLRYARLTTGNYP